MPGSVHPGMRVARPFGVAKEVPGITVNDQLRLRRPVCRHAAIPAPGDAGMLAGRDARMQGGGHAGMRVCKDAGVRACWRAGMPGCPHAGIRGGGDRECLETKTKNQGRGEITPGQETLPRCSKGVNR